MEIGSPSWLQGLDGVTQELQEGLSLEGTVLQERAKSLRSQSVKLARQRAFLREERRRARMEEESLRQDVNMFKFVKKEDWLPIAYLPPASTKRVRVNVGGQLFEASETILRRDPGSLLSALCDDESPLPLGDDGVAYVDRDWWVFRFLLKFLRDGLLPEDRQLLAQLYREAKYWRCSSVTTAIEQIRLNLYRHGEAPRKENLASGDKNQVPLGEMDKSQWWKSMPNWWESQSKDSSMASEERKEYEFYRVEKEKKEKTKAPDDWWLGDEYNGRKFGVADFVKHEKKASESLNERRASAATLPGPASHHYLSKDHASGSDLPATLSSTWGYSGRQNYSGTSLWTAAAT